MVVMLVELFTVKLVAGMPPKVTAVAPVKPVPVMVTLVPPDALPEAGEMPVMVTELGFTRTEALGIPLVNAVTIT